MDQGRDVNVLIIGGTGHGKSFFVNMFDRMAIYRTLDEAVECDGGFVSPIKFYMGDEYITEGPVDETGASEAGSETDETTVYEYPTKYGTVRVIDTPGIGDTRGSHLDEEHMHKIISCMRKFDEIHGILLFFKSSDNRLDFRTKYQLCELLSFLGKAAINSIQFIITHVGVHGEIGNAGGVIKDFNRRLPEPIRLTKENTFCFENDPLKYLVLMKQGKSLYSAMSVNFFRATYENTRAEYVRLFRKLCNGCTPYDVREYRALTMARLLWPKLSPRFSEIETVKEVIARAVKEHKGNTKQTLEMIAAMEVNLEKTKSVYESAVQTLSCVVGGSTASGILVGFLARGGVVAADVFRGSSLALASLSTSAVAASVPAFAIGGALGGLVATGVVVVDHVRTKKRRHDLSEQIAMARVDAVEEDEALNLYEEYFRENEQVKILENDFARCLHHNAILAYACVKEEYVKEEMASGLPIERQEYLERHLEQLKHKREIFEQVSDDNIEAEDLLTPRELIQKVEVMCTFTYYGRPIEEALKQCEVGTHFGVVTRSEVAEGCMFDEVYATT